MVAQHLGSVSEGKRIPLALVEREEIGGFSEPAKMPWLCRSIPADECRTGAKLRDVVGSVCADCYAHTGRYHCPGTKGAMARRFALLDNLPDWVERMVAALSRRYKGLRDKGRAFFRWHDSGDIQSAAHLAAIVDVAERLPEIRFWLPTREYGFVREWQAAGGACPPNLVIRLSAHMVDGPAPTSVGLPVSTVHTRKAHYPRARHCPAYDQGGECGECRTCWNPKVKHVSYPLH